MKKKYTNPEVMLCALSTSDIMNISSNFFDTATNEYVVYALDSWFTGE